jgi:biopolymer transport protein ExbB
MFENMDWIAAMRSSPVMIVILACSVVTLGFAIERTLFFMSRRGKPDAMLADVLGCVRDGNLREASRACAACAHPAGPVVAQVLKHAHLSDEAQEDQMQVALSEQRLLFERNLGVLGTMGNTAPLIGLLGTVWGIMRAFHDMARTGSAGPSVVAAGVAEALFTTAAGLLVAVPAVMLYNHFVRRITVLLTVAENQGRTLRIAIAEGDQAPRAEHGRARAERAAALAPAREAA